VKKRERGRERERVGEVWILFRERGRKRWWREGYKGRNQKRAQHASFHRKLKPHASLSSDGVVWCLLQF
jgi:hypothetical protein